MTSKTRLLRLSLSLLLGLLAPVLMMGQAPVAAFTASVTSGCSPLAVTFTDQSTGAPKSWNWDFGNGQLSTAQNPTIGFSSSGTSPVTYTITLVVRNENGIDQVVKTNYITVNPSPTASFKANQLLACLPANIQFVDQSVANAGTINQWEWHFNDGTPNVTTQNPVHNFVNPGFYDIYLKVTSTTGCTGAIAFNRYVRVVNGVKADFDLNGPFTCTQPYAVNYKNLTSGPGALTYTWDLGNGNGSAATDPPTTYATAGTYTVKLKAQSEFGCVDSTQKNVPIKGVTSSFSIGPDTVVCIGAPVSFQSTTAPGPTKVLWDFGDGTGSSDLKPPPKSYTAANTYPVKLISSFASCSDTLIKKIRVSDKPVVDFTASKTYACKPSLPVTFQDISPDAVSWKWDFGDGSTGTGISPSHTYGKLGSFDVTLSITNKGGCANTIIKKNFINVTAPTVYNDGGPSGVCVGAVYNPIAFFNAPDGITSYAWTFGDAAGGTSNVDFPSYTYTTAGTYTVKLTIVTAGGCSASNNTTVQVGAHPLVDFSADKTSACRTDVVSFTNLTTPASTPAAPTTVLWSFGDTTTSAIQNPQHKYIDTGFVSVKLKVTSMGCTDSASKPNYIYASPPLANFTYTVPDCLNKTNVVFKDSSKVTPLYPATYLWDYGDGTNSGTPSASLGTTHSYPGPPSSIAYNVTLTVSNGVCTDAITKPVQLINEIADFTLAGNQGFFCRDAFITFSSLNPQANVKKYQWMVDGAPLTIFNQSIALKFPLAGTHIMQLVLTDIYGCVGDTVSKSFTVTGPTAKFGASNNGGCKNAAVAFLDSSFTSPGQITKWTFDFGDGKTQSFTSAPFTHQYADTGTYSVLLTVLDNNSTGCQDTARVPVLITKPFPFFSTAQTTFCPGAPLPFKDSSIGKGLTYTWFFGDGSTDNVKNPIHKYPLVDSTYTVKMLVTDTAGCTDSLTRTNYIITKSPKALYSVKDTTSLCPPLETKFTFKGKDVESFSWDFGDGGSSTLDSTSHFYNTYGKFNAKLYVVGYGGCIDSATIPVTVTDFNTNTAIDYTPFPAKACNDLTVHFSLTVPANTGFQLDFGDGTVDTSQNKTVDHFYSLPNNYSPNLTLYDITGCQVRYYSTTAIQVQGAVPLFGADKKKFCDSGSVYFSDYSQDAVDPITSKTWDFGDGTTSQTFPKDATHKYTQPGLFIPTLSVTTQANCVSTFTDTIRVLATPNPVITSVNGICNNLSIDFAGSLLVPPDTGIIWKWDLSGGKTSGQQNVSVNYPDTGVHHITLEATNSLGCKGDTAKDITVFPLPAISVSGDTTTVSGGVGITVPLTYSQNATTFNWTPPDNLSCTDCANPFANPKYTTTYKVKVTDANGCVSNRSLTVVVTCNGKNFFVPNTFSPNSDGTNDRFYPRGTGLNLVQAIRIFNRWGELVFEKRNFAANDGTAGWDGMYKGKPAPTDTYIYMIDIICENANVITSKGNVTLIR